MPDWKAFSEDLEQWRGSPVTEALRVAADKELAQVRESLSRDYLAGRPAPEAYREAVMLVGRWVEAFFERDADDIRAVIEDDNERERNPANG